MPLADDSDSDRKDPAITEGLRLLKAFMAIKDNAVRQRIIEETERAARGRESH